MALKPWYKVVTPREDLRDNRPLDASEFAVHLDHVRDRRAPADYQDPQRFFERTFMTRSLVELATGVIRRLSGNQVQTSAVYNMTTQFGGGKTHALTALWHLARGGKKATSWRGVDSVLVESGVRSMPEASTAVFVGTEFDSIAGRGGSDGTPRRRTPWGEIAFQLGGVDAFKAVAQHDEDGVAPGGEVIRKFLPADKPVLILMDEIMNYVSRSRSLKLSAQLYNFLQNLSEEVRGQANMVLAVSVPASELEMTAEDQSDYERIKKVLDRLGKAIILSAEHETSEIIRRRLFEWGGLPDDARKSASAYAEWIQANRNQVPTWFPIDNAREAFGATYPFHPTVLSVFERKWQALPRFQQTRGVLRLLALWVARAYKSGYEGAHKDPLIGLGTAPLEDPMFRAAAFEQLGETRLEAAITTDIAGRIDSHAPRLDKESVDTIKRARLHQKVASTIFFESNGGQARAEATLGEVRLAVAEPEIDIGNVETALEALTTSSYYLRVEKNRYRYSLSPNLNKLLADRRATVTSARIDEAVRQEIKDVFDHPKSPKGVDRVYFAERSNQIPDRPALALIVLTPEQHMQDKTTRSFIESVIREYGASARIFKSALFFVVPESGDTLREEARKLLAWRDIEDDAVEGRLDVEDAQKKQLAENIRKAERDLKESVWRTYNKVVLLAKNGEWKTADLGLVHSSAADSLLGLVLQRLRQDGDVEDSVSPAFLARNWPPALVEWSTKAVRDAFFASPAFPRLLNPEAIKDTISKGVSVGFFAYVSKRGDGTYDPFKWNTSLPANEIELSDEVLLIGKEAAIAYSTGGPGPGPVAAPPHALAASFTGGESQTTLAIGGGDTPRPKTTTSSPPSPSGAPKVSWEGDVPWQKWTNLYMRVLSKFTASSNIRLSLRVEISSTGGSLISTQQLEEMRTALRELGMNDDVLVEMTRD
jgi:hypothetical protein